MTSSNVLPKDKLEMIKKMSTLQVKFFDKHPFELPFAPFECPDFNCSKLAFFYERGKNCQHLTQAKIFPMTSRDLKSSDYA